MKISTRAGKSRKVVSRQDSIHPQLDRLLEKHFKSQWRQPLHPPSVAAFEAAAELAGFDRHEDLVFDSGCGTGESTRRIASETPGGLVLGIDRSIARLKKTGHRKFPCQEDNIIWIRSELETFWRMALDRSWKPAGHYLLYPNPYPKWSQLNKRWHAHPVFPVLLALGGDVELRCNWQVYAEEFAHALEYITGVELPVEHMSVQSPVSLFERKYAASGHALYRVFVPGELLSENRGLLRGS